ncbi:TIGR03792 family protein [Pseudoflavonifractor sp. MSJ-37]|uniref:TIGR03792 family protein n=1 Tax=Pseudoflavonifractor sp. MSJ-37 TaxID=2841531 RepID=UPI001C124D09|nr:TIGR03792 family protein [Pseudoflavonifractor sp. MSJ-37]MBU5435858.1 TIGR03792 family protein [Pseudoflavonifractor sp. MSJ-37]
MELKNIRKLDQPIAVEEIRVKVTPDWVDRWIALDDEVWTSRLKISEGFLGKELWISRDVPGEIYVVIYWADYDKWQEHDKSGWCLELDQEMERRMEGNLLSMEFRFKEDQKFKCYEI